MFFVCSYFLIVLSVIRLSFCTSGLFVCLFCRLCACLIVLPFPSCLCDSWTKTCNKPIKNTFKAVFNHCGKVFLRLLRYRDLGCLLFTRKTGKFRLENQMVRIIPFGVLLKLWAFGQSDAFLLLLLGLTADIHTFCMLSIFC